MKFLNSRLLCSLGFGLGFAGLGSSWAHADDVDVYFIVGQSNAANFAQRAGTGSTDVGYGLTFARDRTVFTNPNHVDQAFESNLLDTSQAVTLLSQDLYEANDQAIYGFARGGTAISNAEATNWYPGNDPANGQVDDSNMYGDFVAWSNARLNEIVANGDTPVVKGLFWFQGERDAVIGSAAVDAYEDNFENLVYRFRDAFGNDLPIVAAEIREGVSSNAALRADVNDAMQSIAAKDTRLSVVATADLAFVSANDVHLNTTGYQALAPRWATEMNDLQSAAQSILYYDSVENNGSTSLRVIDSLTASSFVSDVETLVSFGGNTSDQGQHGSQDRTVTFGDGTDKFVRFGGASEALDGSLEDAVLDDGEWIGARFTAAQDLEIETFSFEMFVNSANGSSWSARDAALFFRVGDAEVFSIFDTPYEGVVGENGTVIFEDSVLVNAGDDVEWRLAFTDRTNVVTGLPATLSTRLGSVSLSASIVASDRIPGDADGDGDVDLLDLDILGSNWGDMVSGGFDDADFNEDGVVGLLDLDLLGSNWGLGSSADSSFEAALAASGLSVPEPTSAMLLAFASVSVFHRRRSGGPSVA